MANLKEKMLEIFDKKTMIWWRYIDDIFFFWEHGEELLKDFIDQVNIKLIDGELKTDLFAKLTDTHQFLDPTSFHPYRCKKGIPYNQALRLNPFTTK